MLIKPMVFLLKKGWKADLAAGFLMLFSFLCILVPVAGVLIMLGNKVSDAVKNSEEIANLIKSKIDSIDHDYGFNLSSRINTSEMSGWISDNLENFAGSTFDIFLSIGLM